MEPSSQHQQTTSATESYWPVERVLQLTADEDHFREEPLRSIKGLILDDLQADILKGNKHKFTLYCFLTFKEGSKEEKKDIVKWLKSIDLTSASQQMNWSKRDLDENEAFNAFLSYQGYEYFCDPEKISQLIPLQEDDIIAFQEGLSERCRKAFGGENNRRRHEEYRDPSHALLLIASNDIRLKEINAETTGKERHARLFQLFREWAKPPADGAGSFQSSIGEVFFEIGLRNPEGTNGPPREWFGFRDGISNPRFFTRPALADTLGEEPDPPSPLNTALRRNRLSPKPYACGSFVVFLKLEEDPEAFNEMVEELAEKLDMSDYKGYAGAYLMGRHKDGTPLHKSFVFPSKNQRNLNRFDYKGDEEGALCPLHAHIRKANPRDGQWEKRIVRRGKAYGHEKADSRGILFLSYQSSLLHFEDIVNRGLYGYNYGKKNMGKDVLFTEKGEYHGDQKYRNASGKPITPYLKTRKKLITFRGGQYFFASSISFIKVNLENCM